MANKLSKEGLVELASWLVQDIERARHEGHRRELVQELVAVEDELDATAGEREAL